MGVFKKVWKALNSNKTVIGLVLWKIGEATGDGLLTIIGQALTGTGMAHKAVKITKEVSNGNAG